jgi:hypothetical protein
VAADQSTSLGAAPAPTSTVQSTPVDGRAIANEMTPPTAPRSAVFAGSGVGLLLGVAVGMSASPVVAVLIGAITALLGAILGFSSSAGDVAGMPGSQRSRQWGVGAFGLACTVGLLSGVAIRANDLLSPTPEREFQRWSAAKFDSGTARSIVAYRLAGIVPEGATLDPAAVARSRSSSVLFGASPQVCDQLDPKKLNGAENLRTAFSVQGGRWNDAARLVEGLDASRQLAILTTSWRLACEH